MPSKLSDRRRIDLYRALRMSAKNKASTSEAFETLLTLHQKGGPQPNPKLAEIAFAVSRGLGDGQKLANSLGPWIPDLEISILAAGEQAGDLVHAYDDAIVAIKRHSRLNAAVKGATAYPMFLCVLAAAFLFIAARYLVPSLALVKDPKDWTGPPVFLYWLSTFVNDYGVYALLMVLGIGVTTALSMKRWVGGLRVIFDRFPPYSIYRDIQGAAFLSNLAVLVKAGSKVDEALLILMRHANPWLRHRLQATLYGIGQGGNLGKALIDADYGFPSRTAIVFIAQISGKQGFETGLTDFSIEWMDYLAEDMETAGVVFKTVFMIGITVLFGLLGTATVYLSSTFQ
jgi:type II secretory pathway component PulF